VSLIYSRVTTIPTPAAFSKSYAGIYSKWVCVFKYSRPPSNCNLLEIFPSTIY